jgi:hypothetical protein
VRFTHCRGCGRIGMHPASRNTHAARVHGRTCKAHTPAGFRALRACAISGTGSRFKPEQSEAERVWTAARAAPYLVRKGSDSRLPTQYSS